MPNLRQGDIDTRSMKKMVRDWGWCAILLHERGVEERNMDDVLEGGWFLNRMGGRLGGVVIGL
jgi:hypothetical protein